MAYTASALSFMCENLGKPIILTGSQVHLPRPAVIFIGSHEQNNSPYLTQQQLYKDKEKVTQDKVRDAFLFFFSLQVPIYEMRNDGRDNLLGALLVAGQFVIPEVSWDAWGSVTHKTRTSIGFLSHLFSFLFETCWPSVVR